MKNSILEWISKAAGSRMSVRQTVWKLISILATIALLLTSCGKQQPQPPSVSPAASTPQATPTTPGLPVQDTGEPLPPSVIDVKPAGGQELPTTGKIVVTFDQDMDIERTSRAWQLLDPKGKAVTGKTDWPTPRTLAFSPARPLESGATYFAKLGVEAASAEGMPLPEEVSFEFITTGELQVSQVFPAENSQEVEADAVITVIFNRPVAPLVIAEEQADLPNPLEISPAVAGKGEWVNTSIYTFHPAKPLPGSTTFQVTVKAGLEDAAGETRLAQDFTWQFSTIAPRILDLTLSNGVVNPANDYANVLLDEAFTLSFNQPMDTASVESGLTLVSLAGENVPLQTKWNEDATTVVISPTVRLALDTSYTLRVAQSSLSAGRSPLQEGLEWTFRTIPSPAILYTNPANGETQERYSAYLEIRFASPMKIDTVKERIQVTPEPAEPIEWWYNEYDWSMNAYFLEAATRYTIRFLPGMEDIYGNPIAESQVIRFTTANHEPQAGLQMPYQPAIFRVGGPQDFYISYRNIRTFELKLYRLDGKQFTQMLRDRGSYGSYSFPETDLVWQVQQRAGGALNEYVLKDFTPTQPDGSALAPGFYFLGLNADPVSVSRRFLDDRLLIVANSNLTFKSTADQVMAWLTDLNSGVPIANAPITVYDQDFEPIGQGSTGSDGLVMLEVPVPDEPYEYRFVIAGDASSAASQVFAFASSDWGSGVPLYDYGIWGSYYAPPNQPKIYLYTERPIYRPGQPVYFKGVVRLDNDLDYRIPDVRTVQVRIENFAEVVYEEELPLSEFGTFDGSLLLDKEAALGFYTLSASLPGYKDSLYSINFNVAEYRRPEFQVQVSAEPLDVLAGENFSAAVAASYYSGGAVSGAQVYWRLTAEKFTFQPSDEYSGFDFTDVEVDSGDFYDEFGLELVAEGQGTTDQDGKLTVELPADISKYKTSIKFTFEATVTDIAQNAVSGRTEITAHRSMFYVGARPLSYVGEAGEEQSFEVVVLDWESQPAPGRAVDVEIVERRWYSIQEQDPSGRVTWKWSVEEIPVQSFSGVVVDDKGKARVAFVPPKGGVYRAKASSVDDRGNVARASSYMWVSGKEYIPWRQENDRSFDLITDRNTYTPGDTAEILIASPFQGESYALLTVERGRIRYSEVLRLANNSTIYRLPITADMAPNCFVSVLVIKGIDETNTSPNFRMGIKEIKVNAEQQALTVEIETDKPQAGPGDEVQFTVRTRNYQGSPVSAEVSLSLSDLATLSLMDPNSAPILSHFYSERTLGVWTSIPIDLIIEQYNLDIREEILEGKAMGSGGGGKGMDELGVIEVRQDFPDTAYWEAHLITDENGQATVKVTLPDNLTTWRMDARAVTQDTLVGQNTLDIVSTKPLLVRPQTPRFFVPNDEARLGTAVHNNTDQPLSVLVSLEAEGVTLQSEASQTVEIAPRQQAFVTWRARVNPEASRVDLVFSAEGGGYSDASRPTLGSLEGQGIPVYRYQVRETVGTSGMMSAAGTRTEAISLPSFSDEGEGIADEELQGSLTVKISPSLAAGMTDGLLFLEHYPYECVEQTISRFLPNVISTHALKAAGLSDPQLEENLRAQVDLALQRLYNWQNADGGWGWWGRTKSNLTTTAYAVLGLIEAQEAGYAVSAEVLEKAMDFLSNQVVTQPKSKEFYELNRQAFVLYVLARGGRPDIAAVIKYYDRRESMALYARAFLAQALFLGDAGDPRLQTLLSDFNNAAVVSASGTHWEESRVDYWNWNTNTRSTAIILSALSQIDSRNPLNANAVRWLMSSRTAGHWKGTQETAWTLMALTNWMVASGELQANYRYGVALNGVQLGGGEATQENLRQTYELKVDVAEMVRGEINRLAIARDEGAGNLYYTAHLDVSLPVEKVQSLNKGIVLSRSYYPLQENAETGATTDGATPITQAAQGNLLLVRLTIVAPSDLHYVIIEDPLPAGLEAVDQTLNTSPQEIEIETVEVQEQADWRYNWRRGWGWWYFNHAQLRDEKLVLSADFLPAGTYVYTYLVRASFPGIYRVIPPTAQEFYFPEVYGRGEGSLFTVE